MARRKSAEEKARFNAYGRINEMERAVTYAMVPRDWGIVEVLEWTVPVIELDALRKAYPYAAAGDGGRYDVRFPMADGTTCFMAMQTWRIKCMVPHDRNMVNGDTFQFQPCAHGDHIRKALETMHEIKLGFDKVRTLVQWLNGEEMSVGWARHYIPCLGTILAPDHPFHQADGQRFLDAPMPHHIATIIRQVPEIITRGLLAGTSPALEGVQSGYIKFADGQDIQWFRT